MTCVARGRSRDLLQKNGREKGKGQGLTRTDSAPLFATCTAPVRMTDGHSYGLLGPSGCGKTSLLRCILNQLKPASGAVLIFGSKPGSKGSSVPGPGVGYMPQEVALIPEFTILETIHFFGHLNGMSRQTLEERSRFLLRFLDLPHGQRLIRELRSVSLFVSHSGPRASLRFVRRRRSHCLLSILLPFLLLFSLSPSVFFFPSCSPFLFPDGGAE